MNIYIITNIIAWSLLILSWFLPKLIFRKDEIKKETLGTILTVTSIIIFSWILFNNF